MTDFPQMTAAEMNDFANRLNEEIPHISPRQAKANFSAATYLRAAALAQETSA